MNDSFSGKNGKVKVMYVRSDDDNGDDRNRINVRPAKAVRLTVRAPAAPVKTRRAAATIAAVPTPPQ